MVLVGGRRLTKPLLSFRVRRRKGARRWAQYHFAHSALAVPSDGSLVVGYARDQNNTLTSSQAFIWDPANGLRSLQEVLVAQGDNLAGWQLYEATGISAAGVTIVGYGRNPNGQLEAWAAGLAPAQVVPEPSGLILVGLGVLGVVAYGRRSRGFTYRWAAWLD